MKAPTLHRESTAGHLDDWAVVEVLAEQCRVDGGRHKDDSEVRVGVDHVSYHHHHKVRVHVSLVDLVHYDVTHASQAGL